MPIFESAIPFIRFGHYSPGLDLIKVGDQANVAWMYANGIEARLPNPCDASFAAAFVYVVIWCGIFLVLTYLKWTVKL
jgi:hypothetical protein